MQKILDTTGSKYHILFSITWIFSLVIYPVWVEPATSHARLFIYICVVAWTIINITLFYRFLFTSNVKALPSKPHPSRPDTYFFVLLSLLIIYGVLHIYPMSFPIMIMNDEPAHAGNGLALISRFLWMKGFDPERSFRIIRISLWAGFLLAALLFYIQPIRTFIKSKFSQSTSRDYVYLYAALFIISLVAYLFTKNMPFHLALMRYPPIGKVLYALSISLFGINEFAVRIPQLLFTIFGSFFIFKICEDNFNSTKMGLISACVYAYSPMVFYQSSLAELICGTVFFSIIIIYFYLKYSKTNNIGFLIMSFYFISFGFLYKRIIVIMLAVIVISILLLKDNKIQFSMLLKLCYFSLVPIVPYLLIGKIFPNNPFGLHLANWLNPGPAFGYFILLTAQLSYPLYILSAISLFYLLVNKEFLKPAVIVFCICAVLYYVFFTSISIHGQGPYIYGLDRYAMIFYPFIAVSTGLFIDKITRPLQWKQSFNVIAAVLVAYLILVSTVWQSPPLQALFVSYKNTESRYFPVDEAMQWVKNNINEDEGKLLVLRAGPATFYRDKYGVRRDMIVDFWYNLEQVSTPHMLKIFCRENKISYIMFSYGVTEETGILKYLEGYKGDEYEKVTKFKLDGNYIYIYKINQMVSKL